MVHVSAMSRHALPFDAKFHDGQHADLLDVLFRLASSAGARVNFGVTVESVEPARETPPETGTIGTPIAGPASRTLRPTVRLKTGETLNGDVIIGADGLRSVVRRVVTEEDEEPEVTSIGLSVYTGSVPMTKVRKYAPLKRLTDVGWSIWLGDGPGRVVLGTSISAKVLPFADWFFFWESSTSRSESGCRLENGRELIIPGPSFTATTPGTQYPRILGRSQWVYSGCKAGCT